MSIAPHFVNIHEMFRAGSVYWLQQKILETRKVGSTRDYKLEAREFLPII